MKKIYIYGASGHGIVVSDIAKACGYMEIQFIDDGNNNYHSFDEIKDFIDAPIALGIGQNKIRQKIFNMLEKYKFKIQTLVHPSAIIAETVHIGRGTVIMPLTVINANTSIGKGVILNSSSIIEHDNIINNFTHIAPKVACAGHVMIGELTHLGIGTSVIQKIHIGNSTIIGAGSVVVNNIGNHCIAYGNPCKEKKENI